MKTVSRPAVSYTHLISKTGELIRENPLAAAAVFLCGLSLIFFIILRKKRKDDEEEENTKPVC